MSIKRNNTKPKIDQQKLTVEKRTDSRYEKKVSDPTQVHWDLRAHNPYWVRPKLNYISNSNSVLWTFARVFAITHKATMIISPNTSLKINFSEKEKKMFIVPAIKIFGFLHTNILYLIDQSLKSWEFQLKLLYKWDNKVLVLYGFLVFKKRYKSISFLM